MKKKKLQDQINEDALLREVVEDVKNEQIRQLWDKYGLFIIIGVALVLTAAISFESIKSWRDRKNQELSNAYSVAMSLQTQGRLDESLDVYTTLVEKSDGIYQDLAKLQIANIKMQQNNHEEAFEILENIVTNKKVEHNLRNIAAIKLASYLLDNDGDAQKIEDLLLPIAENDTNFIAARELLAMLRIREKNISKAISEYEKIAALPDVAEDIRIRALDMLNVLSKEN